jgi:hypothetical protein
VLSAPIPPGKRAQLLRSSADCVGLQRVADAIEVQDSRRPRWGRQWSRDRATDCIRWVALSRRHGTEDGSATVEAQATAGCERAQRANGRRGTGCTGPDQHAAGDDTQQGTAANARGSGWARGAAGAARSGWAGRATRARKARCTRRSRCAGFTRRAGRAGRADGARKTCRSRRSSGAALT